MYSINMPITLQSGVRFRAYPDAELASTLARWIGCQRFIYNGKVDEDRLFAAQRRLEVVSGNVEVKAPLDGLRAVQGPGTDTVAVRGAKSNPAQRRSALDER
ncbi:helix-turn-helix domain-containing protein [Caballeronia sp. GAOx1]|uniref:helix-turn-helix domain-containing protein n=1 Tax=Caballeronia sp. GAOx1 TaxID=2921761 RepID=UPI0032EB82B2